MKILISYFTHHKPPSLVIIFPRLENTMSRQCSWVLEVLGWVGCCRGVAQELPGLCYCAVGALLGAGTWGAAGGAGSFELHAVAGLRDIFGIWKIWGTQQHPKTWFLVGNHPI